MGRAWVLVEGKGHRPAVRKQQLLPHPHHDHATPCPLLHALQVTLKGANPTAYVGLKFENTPTLAADPPVTWALTPASTKLDITTNAATPKTLSIASSTGELTVPEVRGKQAAGAKAQAHARPPQLRQPYPYTYL